MPTYAYACSACDHRFEIVQSFSDDALTECPQCHGKLRKLFNSVGIVFKGSGFYRTDSRSSGKDSGASLPASDSSSGSSGTGSGSSGSADSGGGSSEGSSTSGGSGTSNGSGSTGTGSGTSSGSGSSTSAKPAAAASS